MYLSKYVPICILYAVVGISTSSICKVIWDWHVVQHFISSSVILQVVGFKNVHGVVPAFLHRALALTGLEPQPNLGMSLSRLSLAYSTVYILESSYICQLHRMYSLASRLYQVVICCTYWGL